MLTISQQQIDNRYDSLPAVLKEALFSTDNADSLWNIGDGNHLSDDKKSDLAGIVGNVILGFIHPDDLAKEIAADLMIDNRLAQQLSEEVNKKIISPVRSEVEKIYRSPSAGAASDLSLKIPLREMKEQEESPVVSESPKEILTGEKPKVLDVSAPAVFSLSPDSNERAPEGTGGFLKTKPKTGEELRSELGVVSDAKLEAIEKVEEFVAKEPIREFKPEKAEPVKIEEAPTIIHEEAEIKQTVNTKPYISGIFGFLKRKRPTITEQVKITATINPEEESPQNISQKLPAEKEEKEKTIPSDSSYESGQLKTEAGKNQEEGHQLFSIEDIISARKETKEREEQEKIIEEQVLENQPSGAAAELSQASQSPKTLETPVEIPFEIPSANEFLASPSPVPPSSLSSSDILAEEKLAIQEESQKEEQPAAPKEQFLSNVSEEKLTAQDDKPKIRVVHYSDLRTLLEESGEQGKQEKMNNVFPEENEIENKKEIIEQENKAEKILAVNFPPEDRKENKEDLKSQQAARETSPVNASSAPAGSAEKDIPDVNNIKLEDLPVGDNVIDLRKLEQ